MVKKKTKFAPFISGIRWYTLPIRKYVNDKKTQIL